MAKTLTEQNRIWSPTASDPLQFGDGAALHSHLAFDMMRALNNLQTYCEPSYQFAFDVSHSAGSGLGRPRIRFQTPAGTTSGVCMLGQLPILVPINAVRLAWHLGIYRDPEGSETAVALNVSDITMYLSSGPCVHLEDPIASNPTPDEQARLFDPSYIQGHYTSNSVVAAATSGSVFYKLITNDGTFGPATWTNFVAPGAANINDGSGGPWAYLIVAATFDTAATGEAIRGADLQVWGEYE